MNNDTLVIVGNGQFPRKEYPLYILASAQHIICCDGALATFLRYSQKHLGGRLPDVVIGDMDSLSPALQKKFADRLVKVDEQEHNDQTKAFCYAMDHFPQVGHIYFLAATGKREDHTIGNISLLMEYCRMRDLKAAGVELEMVSDYATIFPVTDTVELDCGTGRRISILTPDNSLKIKSTGLEWPTDGVVFDNWWKATLNRACEDRVRLEFSHPSLALVIMD